MRRAKATRIAVVMAGAVALAATSVHATGLSYSLSPSSINGSAISGFDQILASSGQVIGYNVQANVSDGLFDAQFQLSTTATGSFGTVNIPAAFNARGAGSFDPDGAGPLGNYIAVRTAAAQATTLNVPNRTDEPAQTYVAMSTPPAGTQTLATVNFTASAVSGASSVTLTPRAGLLGGAWKEGTTLKTGATGTVTGASSSIIGGTDPVVTSKAVLAGGYSANSLTVNGGASLTVASGLLSTGSLSLASTGKLDVGANKVIVRGGNVANIEAQLAAGRNVAAGGIGDGSWDGSHGIVSSAAAQAFKNEGIESKAIGLGVAGQMPMDNPVIPGTSTPVFPGAANGDVMLRYTYNGDATLDGVVDDFDVIVVGALYDGGATGNHHWYEGDFNGDGKIDDSDVILLGAFYSPTAPVLSDAALTQQYGTEFAQSFEAGRALAVPEPATLSLVGLGAMGLLARRRQSR